MMQMQSDSIGNLASALAKVQAEIEDPGPNATNPHFKNKFMDLQGLLKAVRGPLSAQGLSFTQGAMIVEGEPVMMTTLMHESGEWMRLGLPMIKTGDIQKLCGQVTYLRRYGLQSLVGIATDKDDDGNLAAGIKTSLKPKTGLKPKTADLKDIK